MTCNSSFANFGYAGLVGFTLLLALVLWLYDSMAAGRDRRVAVLVISLPAFALANAGLLTSLLTHGIGLAMLLVYVMPAEQRDPLQAHSARRRRRQADLWSARPETY